MEAGDIAALKQALKEGAAEAFKENEKQKKDGGRESLGTDIKDAKEREEYLTKLLALEKDRDRQAQIHIEIQEAILAQKEAAHKKRIQEIDDLGELAKAQKEFERDTKSLREEIDALRKSTDKYEGSANGVADVLGTMAGVSKDFNKTLMGQVKGLFKSGEQAKKFAENLKETFSGSALAEASIQKLIQTSLLGFKTMFTELEEGRTSFARATGMTGQAAAEVMEASKAYRELGVSVADTGAAQAQLMATFPKRELGAITSEVSAQFAMWQKSGVALGDSVGSYDMLRRSFKMTDKDARGLQERIMGLGDEIGMGAPKMMESFARAAPRLAIHGKNMEKVFRSVASTSAQLGLEVDDVLSLAEGFQTFEGSAQAAGKLNSILGGGFIDNIELMNASFDDPAKAALMIKDSFSAAGQSVESLGPAGVKAAAAAAGFSDVAKFTKFLNGEIDTAELAADTEKDMQKNMLEAAQGTQTTLQKFSDAFQKFFNDKLLGTLNTALESLGEMSGGWKAFVFAFGGIFTTLLTGAAGLALASVMGAAEGAVAGPIIATAVAGGNATSSILGSLKNLIPGGASMAGMGGMALTAAKFLGPIGAGLMVGKDALDLASGETTGANLGGTIGGAIGAIGFIGGPLVGAATMAAGNMLGEAVGEYYDKKLEAEAMMPEMSTAADERIDKLTDALEQQMRMEQQIKVSLDVDEYAYRKGFKLSTDEMLNRTK